MSRLPRDEPPALGIVCDCGAAGDEISGVHACRKDTLLLEVGARAFAARGFGLGSGRALGTGHRTVAKAVLREAFGACVGAETTCPWDRGCEWNTQLLLTRRSRFCTQKHPRPPGSGLAGLRNNQGWGNLTSMPISTSMPIPRSGLVQHRIPALFVSRLQEPRSCEERYLTLVSALRYRNN